MALLHLRATKAISHQLRQGCAGAGPISEARMLLLIVPCHSQARSLSTTSPRGDVPPGRWAYTPEAMKGAFRLNPIKNPSRVEWKVNDDPAKLDDMYVRFLGRDGARMLSEETKWLAVTHKSFDQGRRGFNSRLAYFGRNIIVQEAAQYILTLHMPVSIPKDSFPREPFKHPSLDALNNFYAVRPAELMDKIKIAKLGIEVGINQVMRWKPRLPENLGGSGLDVVINQVMFAIIGAIALETGTATASRVVRERIFKRTYGFS